VQPPKLSRPRRPPRPVGPSLPFHIHSEQLKKIAYVIPAMRSVLGVAESTVLKFMIQSHELRTPSMHHQTDRDDGQKCGSLRHRKRRSSRCSGIHADPQHTLTICSDFLVTDRAMEAWYRLPLQTPNQRVRWQAAWDDENS
jgi:hypothetical protein